MRSELIAIHQHLRDYLTVPGRWATNLAPDVALALVRQIDRQGAISAPVGI